MFENTCRSDDWRSRTRRQTGVVSQADVHMILTLKPSSLAELTTSISAATSAAPMPEQCVEILKFLPSKLCFRVAAEQSKASGIADQNWAGHRKAAAKLQSSAGLRRSGPERADILFRFPRGP